MKSGTPDREPTLAGLVRQRRRAAGLTQHELNDLAGVGKRFVVELENGKPTLRMDKVNQVLAVFGRQLGAVAQSRAEVTSDDTATGAPPIGQKDPAS